MFDLITCSVRRKSLAWKKKLIITAFGNVLGGKISQL